MAWHTCPECGGKLNGEAKYIEHLKTKHPVLGLRSQVVQAEVALERAEQRLEEWRQLTAALAMDLPPMVAEMVRKYREIYRYDTSFWREQPETDYEVEHRLMVGIDLQAKQLEDAKDKLAEAEKGA